DTRDLAIERAGPSRARRMRNVLFGVLLSLWKTYVSTCRRPFGKKTNSSSGERRNMLPSDTPASGWLASAAGGAGISGGGGDGGGTGAGAIAGGGGGPVCPRGDGASA